MNLSKKQRIVGVINGNKLLAEICSNLKKLKEQGKTDNEIEDIIKDMNLPLKYHLFILANYSIIMSLVYE